MDSEQKEFQEFLEWMQSKEMLQVTADILERGRSTTLRHAAQGFPKQERSHLETIHLVMGLTKRGYRFLKKKGFQTEALQQFLEED